MYLNYLLLTWNNPFLYLNNRCIIFNFTIRTRSFKIIILELIWVLTNNSESQFDILK